MTGRRRVKTRTQPCDAAQARKRLVDARLFVTADQLTDLVGRTDGAAQRTEAALEQLRTGELPEHVRDLAAEPDAWLSR